MKKIIIIYVAIFMTCLSARAITLAQQADSAYNHEDFAQAVRLYHQAITDDGVSPELYYNLANSYYRIGKLGRAVIYYERALKLDPSFKDARTNLQFVNTKIIDKPEDDSTFLDNLHKSISNSFDPNAWAWTAFCLFVLVLVCIALYAFSPSVNVRKLGFFGGFVVLIVFIYALVIAAQTSRAARNHDFAVIIVPTSNMGTAPGASSTDKNSKIIPIHEGTVVEIVDSLVMPGDAACPLWYDVKINNSTRAWVRSTDVEKI